MQRKKKKIFEKISYTEAEPKPEITAIVLFLLGSFSLCMARGTSGIANEITNTKHQAHERTASPNLIAVLLFLIVAK